MTFFLFNMRAYGGQEGVAVPPVPNVMYSVRIVWGERNFFDWLMDHTNPISFASNGNQVESLSRALWYPDSALSSDHLP